MTLWKVYAQKLDAPARSLKSLRSWCTRRHSNKSRVTSTAQNREAPIPIALERGVAPTRRCGVFRHYVWLGGFRAMAHRAWRAILARSFPLTGHDEYSVRHFRNGRGPLRIVSPVALPS